MAADESTPVPGTEETPPEAPAQERTLTAKLKPVNKAPGSAPATDDIAEQGCGALIMNLGNKLRDFADTAAVIAQLDMVISVDTSIAHLAGAWVSRCGWCCPIPASGAGCWTATTAPVTRRLGCSARTAQVRGRRCSTACAGPCTTRSLARVKAGAGHE